MKCAVCVSNKQHGWTMDNEAITTVNGTAYCEEHVPKIA
jgi:hypothetical protein